MVDSLDIECDGGTGLTLGYKESQGATLWLASVLMTRAGVGHVKRQAALRLIAAESAPDQGQPQLRDDANASLSAAMREAEAFVAMVTTHRLIFVEVKGTPGARVSLKVKWSSNRHDRFHSLADVARTFFGLGPTSISGAVVGVEAASWHLRVHAPRGTHMKRVSLYVPESTRPEKAFVLNSNGIAGRQLAHVRVRRLERSDATHLPQYFRAYLGETPPGVGGPLAILSSALAAMVWLVGIYYDHAFPKVAPNASGAAVLRHPGGITVAVMLAGISAVSGWLISRFSDEAVRRAQFREVLALLGIMAASGAALFSAALRLARIQLVGPRRETFLGGQIHVANTTWFLDMLVAGSIVVMAWGSLLARTARLQQMIQRSQSDGI